MSVPTAPSSYYPAMFEIKRVHVLQVLNGSEHDLMNVDVSYVLSPLLQSKQRLLKKVKYSLSS